MSILLHMLTSPKDTLALTSAAAVAVSEAIEDICGIQTGIKWVNDIFISDKKAAGILCESAVSSN